MGVGVVRGSWTNQGPWAVRGYYFRQNGEINRSLGKNPENSVLRNKSKEVKKPRHKLLDIADESTQLAVVGAAQKPNLQHII